MDIETKLNKAMIDAKRLNLKFNTLIIGRQEREQLPGLDSIGFGPDAADYEINLLFVDKDSFCKAVYIVKEL